MRQVRFLIFKDKTSLALCEGGVYTDCELTRTGEYVGNDLVAARNECANFNDNFIYGGATPDYQYLVVDTMKGVTIDSTVMSSLERWQLELIIYDLIPKHSP